MAKIKNIVIPAVIGFVLSFFISIIATHSFGIALLRGLIFGVALGAFSFIAIFIYSHFLSDGTSEAQSADSSLKQAKSSGSVVDITIDDENLSEDEKAPGFIVSEKGISAEDSMAEIPSASTGSAVKAENVQPAVDSNLESSGAQVSDISNVDAASVENASTAAKNSDIERIRAENVQSNSSEFKPIQLGKKEPAEQLDMLPDIGEISSVEGNANSGLETSDDVVLTSDFAQAESEDDIAEARQTMVNAADAPDHDAKTIASAIRTLLVKDE